MRDLHYIFHFSKHVVSINEGWNKQYYKHPEADLKENDAFKKKSLLINAKIWQLSKTALYKSTGFSFKRGDLNFKTRHELAGDNEHEGPKRWWESI